MVKVIAEDQRKERSIVVLRLANGTIMRVREDSFELEHIPSRPRERKHIEYNDLLLANDFIKETHRLLSKPNYDLEGFIITLSRAKLLIQRIYEPPILLYPHDIEAKDGGGYVSGSWNGAVNHTQKGG